MNQFIKINMTDSELVEGILTENNITYKMCSDPMIFVTEEMLEQYVENCVEPELKPLFRKIEDETIMFLSDKISDNIDFVDIMNNIDLEDIL